MKKQRSISVNFLLNYMVTGLNIIFPVVTIPLVTRALGADAYGDATFAISFASYFSMFSMLGINSYGVRECAKFRDDKCALDRIVKELLTLTLISTVIVGGLYFGSALFIPSLSRYRVLLFISGLSIIFNTLGAGWYFNAMEHYGYIATRTIVVKVLSLLALLLFVHSPNDVSIYVMVTVLGVSGANLFNLRLLLSERDLKHVSSINLRRHVAPAFSFLLLSMATTLYSQIDTLMMGILSPGAAVACYGIASKIKSAVVSISTSLTNVVTPRASYLLGGSKEAFESLVCKTFSTVLLFSLPIAFFFGSNAALIVDLMAGVGYEGAVPALVIVSFATVFVALTNVVNSNICIPLGLEKKLTFPFFFAGVTDFLLNLYVIPRYGAVGAAISTLLAEGVVLTSLIYHSSKFVDLRAVTADWWKALLSAVLILVNYCIIVSLFKFAYFANLLISCLFILCYFCLCGLVNYSGLKLVVGKIVGLINRF